MEVAREDISLLDALREDLRVRSVKDGCSPQGQCGCCTVLVDGSPRVACVTPLRRVEGRAVTTVDGLEPSRLSTLTAAFLAHGASQCGFCTPGILCRLAPLPSTAGAAQVESALLAHLCRCTGWRSIVGAALDPAPRVPGPDGAAERALLEGGTAQAWGEAVVRGGGGFADDSAPAGSLVAVPRASARLADLGEPHGWAMGETLAAARAEAGKVQGRRSGQPLSWPVPVPAGAWDITLQTTWVEPAYLEPDASWCEPGGLPASPLANGGAFGAKADSVAPRAARMLADHFGRAVRVVFSREDTVRFGPKRPPAAGGVRLDGTGLVHLLGFGTTGRFEGVEIAGVEAPPGSLATSSAIRAAGWAEAAVLAAAARARAAGSPVARVDTAEGARVEAVVEVDGTGWPAAVEVEVCAGEPLHEVTLRSYVTGAAHMALGWVCSEAIAVGGDGEPADLTIRSFGVLRARDTPPVTVRLSSRSGPPVRASDAAFAAVAAAAWLSQGLPSRWPTMRGRRQ